MKEEEVEEVNWVITPALFSNSYPASLEDSSHCSHKNYKMKEFLSQLSETKRHIIATIQKTSLQFLVTWKIAPIKIIR